VTSQKLDIDRDEIVGNLIGDEDSMEEFEDEAYKERLGPRHRYRPVKADTPEM
jgi:hypothetical protein